ncbi:SDR family oxidoreductase [Streptomyces sp. DT203]|uniref:SDR family oxidoreductase n=1 Tax=Streptomyces sp. DT203 TaxID=3393424 RepID=UPI003CF79313
MTGGTGTLGREVTDRLRTDGHEVRVLSRRSQPCAVDLRDGTGLGAAVDGADTIVHCAAQPRGGDDTAAGHLIEAAKQAGVPHPVHVSIVGVDRVPLGYNRVKRQVEQMVEDSGLGWTILRSTQFHDLVLRVPAAAARLPVMPLPAGVRPQSIDTGEVADRPAELAVAGLAGRVPEMRGPEVRELPEPARAYLRATGKRRPLVPVPLAGKAYAGYRRGGHPTPRRAVGKATFEEFLTERCRRRQG